MQQISLYGWVVNTYSFIFGKSWVQILAQRPAILTEDSHGFSQVCLGAWWDSTLN
jgi:hypothetical protein